MVEINSYKCSSIGCNSIECIQRNSIDTSNLNNEQFWLNRISETEDYLIAKIKERVNFKVTRSVPSVG